MKNRQSIYIFEDNDSMLMLSWTVFVLLFLLSFFLICIWLSL